MSSNTPNPEKLIQEAISFFKKERELYGDFLIENSSDVSDAAEVEELQTTSTPNEANQVKPSKLDQCTTLQELEALCHKAEVLKTDLEDTKMVFGGGNPDADLMLIGEAPGAEENKTGKPFVGRAGQLLNKILAAINFSRDDIYISNILKHRPPDNRNPLAEERDKSMPFLLRQIDLVSPKLILALGKVSAQSLLNRRETLTQMRGQFHTFRDQYQLLVTYHPAALLRNPNWKAPTWEDVQMLRKRYDELGGQP